MDIAETLRGIELFAGLQPEQLESISAICQSQTYQAGALITQKGQIGSELYFIESGWVEILGTDPANPRSMVELGRGQIFGEMALVDYGPRSATVRAQSEWVHVQAIGRDSFLSLCAEDTQLGYIVMRNLAADLSFKVRHKHLSNR